MSKPPKPKGDVDEEVQWIGAGMISPISEPRRPIKVRKRNPIGFIWPKAKAKAKKK